MISDKLAGDKVRRRVYSVAKNKVLALLNEDRVVPYRTNPEADYLRVGCKLLA
jgi:hypothetical protein